MILPSKHISPHQSIIGAGAVILEHVHDPTTVTALWERVRSFQEIRVYSRFVLALDLLYAIGALDLKDSMIVRSKA